MTKDERYGEEYGYDKMATLELGVQEGGKYNTDPDSSDGVHPCVKYKTWIFSLLIGSCLLATSGFSLYLGNLFPSEMDYLRCAAGSCLPAAVVNFAVLKTKDNVISHYQILFVSTFSITTTCLIWFGCKLAINPTAININFNVILLILMEIFMATTVIVSARSSVDCCLVTGGTACGSSSSLHNVQFPIRTIKSYSIVEMVVGISAVFGGVIALHIDALMYSPYLYISIFWVLAACFPSAIASHVAAEYPSNCLVEVLIAISSVTSPVLFTTSAYLSVNVGRTIDFLKTYPLAVENFHEVLLLLLMLILLIQAVLTNVTIIQCVHYKSQTRLRDSLWNVSNLDKSDYRSNEVSSNSLRDFDKEKAWRTVMVQMSQ
ncbi:membrane protein MLC1 isoform X1 [Bufo gargarizans]|uniref:membrane protein MLC1 isoform X1 n=1 Tax=Bufo gargarizans TaxID=30331 RepID=UPI001CF3D3FE|nr:membrane protein MLC1 isoform X1 [Bufo gargarizans]